MPRSPAIAGSRGPSERAGGSRANQSGSGALRRAAVTLLLACVLACVTAGCTSSSGAAGAAGAAGAGATPGGEETAAPLAPRGEPAEAGASPVLPAACGDPGVPPCASGSACKAATDCASGVCAGATCAAPSPTDGVRNGDESDVDCGGSSAPKCVAGKACKVHADCASDACPTTTCAAARSCRQHFGGETCGAGETDDPARVHEDCCLSIRPDAKPYSVDQTGRRSSVTSILHKAALRQLRPLRRFVLLNR
jgi:hypothetical protein